MRLAFGAQCVPISTEHQRRSTENQADVIQQFAERRAPQVVRTYADEGRRGLRLDDRDGLKRLIEDVQRGKADFTSILVYDVGAVQDADDRAYYEYICHRAGIAVQYCAEKFENDGSPVAIPVAIMPFADMSGGPDHEYFVDGLVKDIITALARFRSLHVVPRSAAFVYKGKPYDLQQTAAEATRSASTMRQEKPGRTSKGTECRCRCNGASNCRRNPRVAMPSPTNKLSRESQ